MAIVILNKEEIMKIVGNSESEIENTLNMLGASVENITEKEIEVEIAPNRPDMLSQQGIKRALLSFIGKEKGLRNYKVNKPDSNYVVEVASSVKKVRPYTTCAIIKNIKFDNDKIKEIIEIQEKIHSTLGRNRKRIAIGIYPLEKIKLPIRYEARKPEEIRFVPLDSNEEMNGIEILQKHPTGKQYCHLLHNMEKFPVFVDSVGEILSMPPIINSEKTGKITEKTKDVFIECSGFDLDILKKTLNILVTTLSDMGGDIYQMVIKYKNPIVTPDLKLEKIKINIANVNRILGVKLNEKKIKLLLEKMGYCYKKNSVLIPPWRVDIMHEVDIIEDIAIAYGYDKFEPEIPMIATIGEENKKEIIKRKISELLIGLNMLETSNYHLVTLEDIKKFHNGKDIIKIEKSKTEYKILRPNLIISLLIVLSRNIDSKYPQKIFEFGRVFKINKDSETGIEEIDKLAIAIAPGNFTEIKQILNYILDNFSISCNIKECENPNFIGGRVGNIVIDGKNVGIIGEIHPKILEAYNVKSVSYTHLTLPTKA